MNRSNSDLRYNFGIDYSLSFTFVSLLIANMGRRRLLGIADLLSFLLDQRLRLLFCSSFCNNRMPIVIISCKCCCCHYIIQRPSRCLRRFTKKDSWRLLKLKRGHLLGHLNVRCELCDWLLVCQRRSHHKTISLFKRRRSGKRICLLRNTLRDWYMRAIQLKRLIIIQLVSNRWLL